MAFDGTKIKVWEWFKSCFRKWFAENDIPLFGIQKNP
jgi:hypothetical protein